MLIRTLAVLLLISPSAFAAEPVKPNFLWLVGEDFSADLGCYGTKEVHSPNLDRLAANGVRFTRAFTTCPVCSPSRSAFMTGMYQTTIGAHHHRSHRGDGHKLPDGVKVISDWMRNAGYFTANIVEFPNEVGVRGTGKTDWNFTPPVKPFDSKVWTDLKEHQPFFAQVNFQETHRNFRAPKLADPEKVELPPIYPDHPTLRRDWADYLDAASELDRKIGKILEQLKADGLAETTVVVFMGDHGQAHIRGKQFCYDDGLRIPLIVYWPKGVPMPKGFEPGSVDGRLVEAIDLAPTFLALAGAAKPAKIQGRILFGEQRDPERTIAFAARDRCDETVFRLRTARDSRYRYIKNFTPEKPFFEPNAYKKRQYPAWTLIPELAKEGKLTPWQQAFYTAPRMPAEELYDMETDPWSMRNLIDSDTPEHREARDRLRAALEQWLIASDDQGRFPEPANAAGRPQAK